MFLFWQEIGREEVGLHVELHGGWPYPHRMRTTDPILEMRIMMGYTPSGVCCEDKTLKDSTLGGLRVPRYMDEGGVSGAVFA